MRVEHSTKTDMHQPDVPGVLSYLAASTRAASGSADWLNEHDIAKGVCATLNEHTTGREPKSLILEVIIASIAQQAEEWSAQVLSQKGRSRHGSKVEAKKLDDLVHSGALALKLRGITLTSARKLQPLEQALAQLARMGIDAEELCWSVIAYDAQWHIRLIWHEANKLVRVFPDRTSSDLLGWGWQGLHVALRNFDPHRGFRFSTYACQRVSGAIRDGVRSENPVPKRLLTFHRKVMKAEEQLSAELGRVPSLAEIAGRMGETQEALSILPRLNNPASIEEMTWDESRTLSISDLVDSMDPADMAIAIAQREAIEGAINNLPHADAEVARLLLLEGLSPAEARERTGASPRQLRQRWNRSRETLATALVEWR